MRLNRKLTDDQVRQIRESERPIARLAAENQVDRKVIRRVKRRDAYRDVPDQVPDTVWDDIQPHNVYLLGDGLDMLQKLPDAYAETIVTRPQFHRTKMSYEEYADLHRRTIQECVRVAGPRGVLFYIHQYEMVESRLLTLHDVLADFPLRQIIVWVKAPPWFRGKGPMRQLPQHTEVIFLIAGPYWHVPVRYQAMAERWGEVWQLTEDPDWPYPEVLAEHCIHLGQGRVLDPFAGRGIVGLVAASYGRDWLLFGTNPAFQETFYDEWSRLVDNHGVLDL